MRIITATSDSHRDMATVFLRSANAQGYSPVVYEVPDHSPRSPRLFKAQLILSAIQTLNDSILWIDCDTIVIKNDLDSLAGTHDMTITQLAGINDPRTMFNSGVVWFNHTYSAVSLLNMWMRLAEEAALETRTRISDDLALYRLFKETANAYPAGPKAYYNAAIAGSCDIKVVPCTKYNCIRFKGEPPPDVSVLHYPDEPRRPFLFDYARKLGYWE